MSSTTFDYTRPALLRFFNHHGIMVRLFSQHVSHSLVPTVVEALRARVISDGSCGSHRRASLRGKATSSSPRGERLVLFMLQTRRESAAFAVYGICEQFVRGPGSRHLLVSGLVLLACDWVSIAAGFSCRSFVRQGGGTSSRFLLSITLSIGVF